ncbi:STAS domain-containing protein [Streptomyces kunmingensis]|uniref:Anti-sigma factor antagonist n=1 Tax=Streptomyces kunmingensis TaxID=68225 RepID=A0ABU6C582_9ACTN|nr:STAS domain-containing protein [Streptomyces kunmingensis]MEB3959844.1 STAS domain-containing protein [Streptomyces kunmingensis]
MHPRSTWAAGYIRVHETHGLTVVEFHSEIDIAAGLRILPVLDEATAPAGRTVVLDLGPVTFFDVYGLRLLCRAQDRVHERGGRLLLVCAHQSILKLLHVSGLLSRFAPYPELRDAVAAGLQQATGARLKGQQLHVSDRELGGGHLAHDTEGEPVPVGQDAGEPQGTEASGAGVADVAQVDQDGGGAGADGAVQQPAERGFGGRSQLRPHLDHQTSGEAPDHDR